MAINVRKLPWNWKKRSNCGTELGCCSNRCTATLNNDKDEGDPMENNADWAYTEAILNWAMKNNGNVEGESDETILCGEGEAMLQH